MLVTDLLNVSTDFAVVTLVSEDTLEDFTEVSLVIDNTKHSQKKVGTFFWGGNSRKILVRRMLLPNAVATVANAIAVAVAFDVLLMLILILILMLILMPILMLLLLL